MISTDLATLGFSSIPGFIGVFAIDKIPPPPPPQHSSPSHYSFIVNNQSSNLPGQHWIGVSVLQRNKEAYIYDPLGLPPPRQLTKNLIGYRIVYNTVQHQPNNTILCGQFVLLHLINKSNFLNHQVRST